MAISGLGRIVIGAEFVRPHINIRTDQEAPRWILSLVVALDKLARCYLRFYEFYSGVVHRPLVKSLPADVPA